MTGYLRGGVRLPGNHGVPTPMYFKGVLTDGGGANEFISATSRGRGRN